jgi:hypothetical protein
MLYVSLQADDSPPFPSAGLSSSGSIAQQRLQADDSPPFPPAGLSSSGSITQQRLQADDSPPFQHTDCRLL